ncbi:MAG: hypothetical protein JO242_15480 [Streptosporangiaceae bacterium]|nr:hypothetical protein [Streptosporangiaceae bacterium]
MIVALIALAFMLSVVYYADSHPGWRGQARAGAAPGLERSGSAYEGAVPPARADAVPPARGGAVPPGRGGEAPDPREAAVPTPRGETEPAPRQTRRG